MTFTASPELRWSTGCFLALAAFALAPLACSSDDDGSAPTPSTDAGTDANGDGDDAGREDASSEAGPDVLDDAGADASDGSALTAIDEKEPNDTADTIQSIPSPPVAVKGSVDPVGDIDAFRVKLQAGDFVVWRIEPSGTWSPYLAVIEKDDAVPHYVGHVEGGAFELEQFVTKSSDWQLLASDWNNVKSGGTKVGGPTFGYVVKAEKVARTPTPIAVGATATQSLATPYAAALFALTLTTETGLDVEVRAKRKASPSDMDSRITLFDRNKAQWVATNDDLALDQTDSKLGSDALPAGDYVIVVENVDPASQDRSFELAVTARH